MSGKNAEKEYAGIIIKQSPVLNLSIGSMLSIIWKHILRLRGKR